MLRVIKCYFEHSDRETFFDWTVILHCTKRTQKKFKIGQWRLLDWQLRIKQERKQTNISGGGGGWGGGGEVKTNILGQKLKLNLNKVKAFFLGIF